MLNKNGYCIFDINSLYGFDNVAQGTLTIDSDDRFIAIDAHFEESILYTDITLFSQADTKERYIKQRGTIQQYYYSNEKLTSILMNIGFEVEKIMNVNLHTDEECDKYIFICKKGE